MDLEVEGEEQSRIKSTQAYKSHHGQEDIRQQPVRGPAEGEAVLDQEPAEEAVEDLQQGVQLGRGGAG